MWAPHLTKAKINSPCWPNQCWPNEFTKTLDWPRCHVYRHEIDEKARTLKLWVRRKRGNGQSSDAVLRLRWPLHEGSRRSGSGTLSKCKGSHQHGAKSHDFVAPPRSNIQF